MSKLFLLDADLMDDSQLMRLDAESFRFWVLLLALMARLRLRVLPDVDVIDFRLHVEDEDKTASLIRGLLEKGVLVEEGGKCQLASEDVTWELES